jgi:2-polyprenyl-3-methyl-5-hydroxy-6-metoxy-1,4-benzoquinol methylase
LFPDIKKAPQIWIDVGAGYGEFLEALQQLLPEGSVLHGLEPMLHKVDGAKKRGLPVTQGFLHEATGAFSVVSLIDVFSHLPDFKKSLHKIKSLLMPKGEVLIKTGNAADLKRREEFPGPLNLPDHLVFGGEHQLKRYLEEANFEIISAIHERIDTIWYCAKNLIKACFGQTVFLGLPYTSASRIIWIRARLKSEIAN